MSASAPWTWLLFGILAPLSAQEPDTPVVAVENGRWFTGSGFVERTFYIEAGVLRSHRPARVDSVLDLGGGFVIPPFGDAHTHNLDGLYGLEEIRDRYVDEGTFYVSVLTNTASGADRARPQFDEPCTLDVIYANGGLTSTLSHPFLAYEPRAMGLYQDWEAHADEIRASRIRENDAYWFIDSLADLDRTWPRITGREPDIIKIFLLDAVEEPPRTGGSGLPVGHGLRPSLVRPIVDRAHRAGLRVAAHVETAGDLAVAVAAGVDLVAHVPGYLFGSAADGSSDLEAPATPFEIPESLARDAGERAVAMTPTIAWTFQASGPDSAAVVARRHALLGRSLARLRAHGVRLVLGSDWYGETGWHEVQAMRALGVWGDAELLTLWAVETPQAIFPGRRIGKLEDGYEASFLVLAEDPLVRLDAVRDIALRVKQGCVLGTS